jgi:hypothetical protein
MKQVSSFAQHPIRLTGFLRADPEADHLSIMPGLDVAREEKDGNRAELYGH